MHKRGRSAAIASLLFACEMSMGQTTDLSGNYEARFEGPDGSPRTATLVIKSDGATWKTNGGVRSLNKCIGKETPASVEDVAADSFTLTVYQSKILAGCADVRWKFKRTDAKTYVSTMSEGRALTLVKQ